MKLIKAIIQKYRTAEKTSFNYPKAWDKTKINVAAFEDSDTMGNVLEYCVGIIHDDKYAEELITANRLSGSNRVVEIDEEEANQLGRRAKSDYLRVDDIMMPELLLAASKDSQDRTAEEEEMLNPSSPRPGIRNITFDIRRWFPSDENK